MKLSINLLKRKVQKFIELSLVSMYAFTDSYVALFQLVGNPRKQLNV